MRFWMTSTSSEFMSVWRNVVFVVAFIARLAGPIFYSVSEVTLSESSLQDMTRIPEVARWASWADSLLMIK